jgi:hypothetical protein
MPSDGGSSKRRDGSKVRFCRAHQENIRAIEQKEKETRKDHWLEHEAWVIQTTLNTEIIDFILQWLPRSEHT